MRTFRTTPLALAIASIVSSPMLLAEEVATAEKVETIVVTGTRVAGRTISDTAVPVDLVRSDVLERSGTTELNQALSIALPSFNFPRPGLADGTDTIRPATLRGLSPDQSLVLVNSKRRHAAALVNVNGTVGRGASAVDLNTIPIGAISAIEVLRDGASAQYGSDAIAGVMNIRLREAADGGSVTLGYSYRDTSYTTPTNTPPEGATWSAPGEIKRSRNDGETITLSGWKGFELGDNGFLTLSAEYKDQERTERGGWDFRQQYPFVDGDYDSREQTINRFNAWYGEPEMQQWTLFANAGITTDHGKWYGWASYQNRQATSGGFYRRALDARNVVEIYPDGFLPLISPDVDDFSAAFGYEWDWGEWQLDSSLVYGSNKMAFTIENTLNRSIGPTSKTAFDAGGYKYNQWVYNLSGVTAVDVDGLASALNVALGLEARREGYAIFAGEPDSYRNGGATIPVGQTGCTTNLTQAIIDRGFCNTASGSQVFPGFRPSNEVDVSRTAVGAYLDLEANITDDWLASAAIRAERYSDFGSNMSGKLATRYDFTEHFALRGSLQNGFRAPSLQQQNFTATSTNFIGGIPFDITTFPVSAPVAIAMGAKDLDAEKSANFSLGAVMRFNAVTVTVDAYRIDIDNRIVLSENLVANTSAQGQALREFFDDRGFNDIGGGRFFINGVDTETQGVDVVVNWTTITDNIGNFDFTLVGNFNKTKVTRVPETEELAALDPAPTLFARVNVLTFEKGTPKDKLGAIVNWTHDRFGATLKATRYGEVLAPNANPANDFILSPKTLVDLEGRYQLTNTMRLAFGADNLFDSYPDAFSINLNGTGNTPFSNYSPFGRAGRMLYARLTYDF